MHWGFTAGGSGWGPVRGPSVAIACPLWLLTCPSSVLSSACSNHGYSFVLICNIINAELLLIQIAPKQPHSALHLALGSH